MGARVAGLAAAAAALGAGLASSSPAGVLAGRPAGIGGVGITGLQVQNLDPSEPASIVAEFYPQDCGLPTTISLPATAGGAAASIYLPSLAELRHGTYAALISADREIAALARTDWNSTGGAAIYSHAQIGHDLAVPLVMLGYYGQTSLVTVHNTDVTAPAQVHAEVYALGSATPALTTRFEVCAGTSRTIRLGMDPLFLTLPRGFVGSMRLTSASPISGQVFVDIETSQKAIYAFEAVPVEAAAETLYAPLFRARQRGGGLVLDTGIAVANPGDAPVDVTVAYHGASPACAGQVVSHGPVTVAGHGAAVFYQGPGGGSGLPDGCIGSAVVSATGGGVIGVVNDSVDFTRQSGAYNLLSAAQAGKKIALPLFRRAHVGLTTGIQVMNVGAGMANVTIAFAKNDGTAITGCAAQCTATIAAEASVTWWPADIGAIPDGTFGSAVVESDQPIVAIVNDFALKGGIDSAIYNGIRVDAGPSEFRPMLSVPFIFNP